MKPLTSSPESPYEDLFRGPQPRSIKRLATGLTATSKLSLPLVGNA
jgi:hypothetical protein